MISPLLDETLDSVHLVLKDAGLVATVIDEILLVGGSTRTPLLQQRLEQEFGMAPRFEVDPDLCVAAGAALQAAMINGAEIRSVLVDVTPYTFGVSALGEIDGHYSIDMFVPMIRKNTPIPVTRSELFFTSVDGQETVEIKVFQGEHQDARENLEVGRFKVEGLVKRQQGSEIIARFTLDSNGILQVSATEKSTGLAKSITISNVLSDGGGDSLTQARQKIHQLFREDSTDLADDSSDLPSAKQISPQSAAVSSRHVQARALIDKAHSLFTAAGEDDREDMIDLIEAIDSAIAHDDTGLSQTLMDELSEIIFYLES
jgi:molecular chaperone DnaK